MTDLCLQSSERKYYHTKLLIASEVGKREREIEGGESVLELGCCGEEEVEEAVVDWAHYRISQEPGES